MSYDKDDDDFLIQELSYRKCIFLCKKIIEIINQFHKNGIVHRDIKPENILYNKNKNTLKIIDFENCYIEGIDKNFRSRVGTFAFMDARLFNLPKISEADFKFLKSTDLFSLGCTLYEIITEEPLYDDESDKEKKINLLKFDNVTIDEKWKEIILILLNHSNEQEISLDDIFKRL